jgi:hypothetical protein
LRRNRLDKWLPHGYHERAFRSFGAQARLFLVDALRAALTRDVVDSVSTSIATTIVALAASCRALA